MRRALILLAFLAAGAGSVATAAPAHASLIGQNFTATYQFPALGTVYASSSWMPSSFNVGLLPETVGDVEGVTQIATDFTAASLSLVLTTTLASPTWNATMFNGPVFTATLPHGIQSASVAAGTTMAGFDASRVSFTPTEIRIDWNGLSYANGTVVSVDFTFIPVPEPASLALFGVGLLGLAAVRRRVHPVAV